MMQVFQMEVCVQQGSPRTGPSKVVS